VELMSRTSVRPAAEIIALYERAAAALAASARLADEHAHRAGRAGDDAGARRERARAQRARVAAERARRTARSLRLRDEAHRLFWHPPRWSLVFAGRDTPDARRLDILDAAVIATDLDGIVKAWNAAAERLYGWTAGDVIGRPITSITVGPDDIEVAERIMESVRSSGAWEGEFWVTRDDGDRFVAYVRDVVVADDDGRPFGLVGLSVDLTSERRELGVLAGDRRSEDDAVAGDLELPDLGVVRAGTGFQDRHGPQEA
jgi:PAS domain S-box-containing protein